MIDVLEHHLYFVLPCSACSSLQASLVISPLNLQAHALDSKVIGLITFIAAGPRWIPVTHRVTEPVQHMCHQPLGSRCEQYSMHQRTRLAHLPGLPGPVDVSLTISETPVSP